MTKQNDKRNAQSIREAKGLTQAETVNTINCKLPPNDKITVDMLTRFENGKTMLSFTHLTVLKNFYGCSYEDLLGDAPPELEALDVENNWKFLSETEKKIKEYIEIKELINNDPDLCKQILKLVNAETKKPIIAVIGRPDAGKTTIIIEVTGKEYFPAQYQPTTSVIIHIRHINDKPDWMENNLVLIIKEDDKNDLYTPEKANDKDYCEKHLMACGDYTLLTKFGVHSKEDDRSSEIGAVVVYIDSPILENCDLVDLPGFDSLGVISSDKEVDSRDSEISNRARKFADGYIYLCSATNFMYGDDIVMSQAILKSLPALEKKGINNLTPLGNIFFVASHANSISYGNKQELKELCDNAAERIWPLIEDNPCISSRTEITGYDYDLQTFKNRFFTFEKNNEDLSRELKDEIKALTEMLPLTKNQTLREDVSLLCTSIIKDCRQKMDHYNLLLNNHQTAKSILDKLNNDKSNEELKLLRKRMEQTIKDVKSETAYAITGIFNEIINPLNVLSIIENLELKKNKKDMERLINILNSKLEAKITKILESRTKDINERISRYLQDCEKITFNANFSDHLNSSSPLFSFNVERAFASGLSGASVLGALAAWAATCGNLGGYIIIAKVVGALASIGIHVGGTAAAVSAVSALGGPAVFAVTTAIIAGITTILALGGTWKKSIGNKIVKQYNEKSVLNKLIDGSNKYWDDTLAAFSSGAEQIENKWVEEFEEIKNSVVNFNSDDITQKIKTQEELLNILSGLNDMLNAN